MRRRLPKSGQKYNVLKSDHWPFVERNRRSDKVELGTAILVFAAATLFASDLALGFAIRWKWVIAPYADLAGFPPMLAIILTFLQWILVGLWVNSRIQGVGWWRAFCWTAISVTTVGWAVGLLVRALGYRHVFEGI